MSPSVNELPCYMNSERYPPVNAINYHHQRAAMITEPRAPFSAAPPAPVKRKRSSSPPDQQTRIKKQKPTLEKNQIEVIEIESDDDSKQPFYTPPTGHNISSSAAIKHHTQPALEETTLQRYMIPPVPAHDHKTLIYTGSTYSPLLIVAIITLAERNLPFTDFTSAWNHVPNVPYYAPNPTLRNVVFNSYRQYEPRASDLELFVTFVPGYYEDGRHCLGYTAIMPYLLINGTYLNAFNSNITNPTTPSSMLYTPCTDADLESYGLVRPRNELDPRNGTELPLLGGHWTNEFNEGRGIREVMSIWAERCRLTAGGKEDN